MISESVTKSVCLLSVNWSTGNSNSANWSDHHLIISRLISLSFLSYSNWSTNQKYQSNQSVRQFIISQLVSLSTISQPVSLSVNDSLGQSVDLILAYWSTTKK